MKTELESLVRSRDIYLYGCGRTAQFLSEEARSCGLSIAGHFDSYTLDPDCSALSGEARARALVVVTLSVINSALPGVVSRLESLGYRNIVHYSLFLIAMDPDKHRSQIERTQRALSDTLSREIHASWLESMDTGVLSPPHIEPIEDQYFSESVPLRKGFSRFIDCGTFTGDTIEELYRRRGTIESLVMFEPDLGNAELLAKRLSLKRYAEQQILFPCAVWRKNEYLAFKSTNTPLSAISSEGEASILALSIDSCLADFRPTLIKMDIEGAELAALEGASRTISRHKPDLAICVYHSSHDVWSIPAYLLDLNPAYRFYLRTYSPTGAETVLYATCN